jgi:hypothetical protein
MNINRSNASDDFVRTIVGMTGLIDPRIAPTLSRKKTDAALCRKKAASLREQTNLP